MIQTIVLLFLSLITAVTVNVQTGLLIAVSFLLGKGLTWIICGKEKSISTRIYGILFLAGWIYMLLCYWFMTNHGYDWLFTYDTINYYIPTTESYIDGANDNLFKIYQSIFKDYSLFSRDYSFYLAYTCTWGLIIKTIGGVLYLGLQTSTLFIYAFVGVCLYKLFIAYGFNTKKSFCHTLVIAFCSIIFFYSSLIMRDVHVLLCYLIAFYLASTPRFSIVRTLELLFVVLLTCGLRIESGLFLLLTIPGYLFFSVQVPKYRIYAIAGSSFVLIIIALFVYLNFQVLLSIYRFNSDFYIAGIEEGTGMIATFQRIPVIGDILSIIYNASQPMPVWSKFDSSLNSEYGGYVNNIMNFPRITSAFFNVLTYTYCILLLFDSSLRKTIQPKLNKAHLYQVCLGLLYLYLQSAVISQRRLMGYYVVFYILFCLLFDNLSKENKRFYNITACVIFIVLQIIGIAYTI